MMDETNPLEEYCKRYSQPPAPWLDSLERETFLSTLAPRMLSGSLQGQFLRMLTSLLRPQRILEVGAFTGYAALSMAEALPEGGRVVTIEANDELEHIIMKYARLSGMENRLRLIIGDALQVIPSLDGPFDMVFIDANKREYARYYELVFDKVRRGGIIIADNALWDGKVLRPASEHDLDTASIHAFNQQLLADDRVDNLMLPLRDGLHIARKR